MDAALPQYTETLDIENFLSLKKSEWDIKPFNIITGDMGSGKSLCIKVLNFFEEILVSSILLAPGFSRKLFENGIFFEQLSKKFSKLFYLNGKKYHGLRIVYSCKINGSDFTISVEWDDNKNDLFWKCDYLDKNLSKWSGYFSIPETPDMAQEVRTRIFEDIRHDFLDKLPIANMFVPASRAALAVVGSYTPFKDTYLYEFAQNKDFLLSYFDVSLSSELANILKVKNIKKNPLDENDVVLVHKDGRMVPSLFSSSGQQELVYLLLLMKNLPAIEFNYGRMLSIFIEEPSAHLFPQEQKELIESIAALFRTEKEAHRRFFITTHSPYVLNVINNMLRKGTTIEKCEERNIGRIDQVNEKISFPALFAGEISALFINEDGTETPMLDPVEKMLFADKIANISYLINKDTQKLDAVDDALFNTR
jgi:ABC-type lipoprotein export system ATPase subunit